MEAEGSGLELLITVVVGAADDQEARAACQGLLRRIGGRIVGSGDCSDEEPGCWSVTVSRAGDEVARHHAPAALSRQVRNFLRELGPDYTGPRVSCEPPTAWTVLDNPELVGTLVPGGERMLVEAWLEGSLAPEAPTGAPHPAAARESGSGAPPDPGSSEAGVAALARLRLVVDVVTDRPSGAEWPARALASRLSSRAAVTDRSERPPMVRISLDLGDSEGSPAEVVTTAASSLGGDGWTRPRTTGTEAVMRWSAAPTPESGIAAVQVAATGVTAGSGEHGPPGRWAEAPRSSHHEPPACPR